MALKNNQIKYLVGIAHSLKPVVTLASKGLSETVVNELEIALDHHELIKVKLRGDRDQRKQWVEEIALKTKAEVVQKIGMVACYYRHNPEKPTIKLPR
jgi:RNA-binding protein